MVVKYTQVRRIILFFLTISFFLFVFLFTMIVILMFLKRSKKVFVQDEVENYRYVRIDLSKNETSVGFAQLQLSEDTVEYEDEEGIYYFYSKIGIEEETEYFKCSGTCTCVDPDSDISERRGPIFNTIATSIAIGVSIFAVRKMSQKVAFRQLDYKCNKLMEDLCEEVFIETVLDECVPIEEQNNYEVERVVCQGSCLKNFYFYEGLTEDDVYFPIDYTDVECDDLSLTAVLDRNTLLSLRDSRFHEAYKLCYETLFGEEARKEEKYVEPKRGCFKSYYNSVTGFFVEHFLNEFCLEGGKVELVVKNEEHLDLGSYKGEKFQFHRCVAFEGNDERDGRVSRIWSMKDWKKKRNPKIDCVIEKSEKKALKEYY